MLLFVRSVLAPLTFQSNTHYVIGHIVDPLGGGLVLVGMLVTLLSREQRRRSALVWLFFVPSLLLAGSLTPFHEYRDLRITRLHILVPFWAVFAGFGYQAVARVYRAYVVPTGRAARVAGFGLIIGAILSWNLYSILVRSPRDERPNAQVLAMKVLRESPADTTVLACLGPWHPLGSLVDAYPDGQRLRSVPHTIFPEMIEAHEPRGDELYLFRIGTPRTDYLPMCSAFLRRHSDRLACAPLPNAHEAKVLMCRLAEPGQESPSGRWLDGNASVQYCR
jgi:hypothetical protein